MSVRLSLWKDSAVCFGCVEQIGEAFGGGGRAPSPLDAAWLESSTPARCVEDQQGFGLPCWGGLCTLCNIPPTQGSSPCSIPTAQQGEGSPVWGGQGPPVLLHVEPGAAGVGLVENSSEHVWPLAPRPRGGEHLI